MRIALIKGSAKKAKRYRMDKKMMICKIKGACPIMDGNPCFWQKPHEHNKACDIGHNTPKCETCIPYVEPSPAKAQCVAKGGPCQPVVNKDECKGCDCFKVAPQPEPMPLIEQTTEQQLADGIARHLLAEWLAINANKTRLEAVEHWEEAQELQDYLSIIGYRNIAKSPDETIEAHDQQVRKDLIDQIIKELTEKPTSNRQKGQPNTFEVGAFWQNEMNIAHIRAMAGER